MFELEAQLPISSSVDHINVRYQCNKFRAGTSEVSSRLPCLPSEGDRLPGGFDIPGDARR